MVQVDTRHSKKGGEGVEREERATQDLSSGVYLFFDGDTAAQETRYRVPNIFRAGVLKHSDVHRKRVRVVEHYFYIYVYLLLLLGLGCCPEPYVDASSVLNPKPNTNSSSSTFPPPSPR